MLIIILSAAFLINFNLIIRTEAQCPRFELYYNSSLSLTCDVNCQDLQRRCPLTTQSPRAGCYCQRNYARNLQQQCIPRSQCSQDCFPNERPIAPLRRDCETSCRQSPKVWQIKNCYRIEERRCVCIAGHCRNQSGQCQKGT